MRKPVQISLLPAAPITGTPAERVIAAAGGVRPLAELLRLDHMWVWRWTQPCDKGGTEGRIPHPQQRPVMRLSRELGWGLTAADILGEDVCDG